MIVLFIVFCQQIHVFVNFLDKVLKQFRVNKLLKTTWNHQSWILCLLLQHFWILFVNVRVKLLNFGKFLFKRLFRHSFDVFRLNDEWTFFKLLASCVQSETGIEIRFSIHWAFTLWILMSDIITAGILLHLWIEAKVSSRQILFYSKAVLYLLDIVCNRLQNKS